MPLSTSFEHPLLIYDDKCLSCTKFARWANKLSRGRIKTVGHYSESSEKIKKQIFPTNYDSTTMFWIVNKSGAYGARSALLPLLKEIIKGMQKKMENSDNSKVTCDYKEMSCYTSTNTIRRIMYLLKTSGQFRFK